MSSKTLFILEALKNKKIPLSIGIGLIKKHNVQNGELRDFLQSLADLGFSLDQLATALTERFENIERIVNLLCEIKDTESKPRWHWRKIARSLASCGIENIKLAWIFLKNFGGDALPKIKEFLKQQATAKELRIKFGREAKDFLLRKKIQNNIEGGVINGRK